MWYTKDINEISRMLKVNLKVGLSKFEADKRLKENGLNKLEDKRKESIIIR